MTGQPRFNDRFEEWADQYEDAVAGRDPQYREVFAGYEKILEAVAEALELPPGARVLEIGTGTGNLARRLLARGLAITAVEPSPAMRRIAERRLVEEIREGRAVVVDGHFLSLPDALSPDLLWDGAASSFAFHHLTAEEKLAALRHLRERLRPGARIVLADTVFADDDDRRAAVREAEEAGHAQLLRDLLTEFYPTVDEIRALFAAVGLHTEVRPLNRFARLVVGR